MSKPLATLGDALMAKGADVDWRSATRAQGIERRPPPSNRLGRPDRGFVEQPEERIDPQGPRRRTETPKLRAPVALIRLNMLEDLESEDFEVLDALTRPDQPPPPEETPPVEVAPSTPSTILPPPPVPENDDGRELDDIEDDAEWKPRKYQRTEERVRIESVRRVLDGATRVQIARECNVNASTVTLWVDRYGPRLLLERAENRERTPEMAKKIRRGDITLEERVQHVKRIINGGRGETARVAAELGLAPASVSGWVMYYKRNNPNWENEVADGSSRTQLSRPTPSGFVSGGPASAMVRVGKSGRSFDVVSAELQQAIERVRELKAELRGMLDD